MSDFKVGDRVKFASGFSCFRHLNGKVGTITKVIDRYTYMVLFDHKPTNEEVDDIYLELVSKVSVDLSVDFKAASMQSMTPKCECGAVHTSFPKHHLSWCPLHKR